MSEPLATVPWVAAFQSKRPSRPILQRETGVKAGEFQGAKAAVTAGVGAGANALVGDVGNNLTPMAPEGSTGLGVAVGMAYLKLQPAEE